MIEKYSCFFKVFKDQQESGFYYEIYTADSDYIKNMGTHILRKSNELFETEQEARFAAIGHIELLEKGES